jgi:hypothetical protein|tara:strand:+ start:1699 stop:1824 length:126 start_codon:yes stop_codon:yes gene_type:complete
MKRKEKSIRVAQETKNAWALPKKVKGGFDEALISLGVHIKN